MKRLALALAVFLAAAAPARAGFDEGLAAYKRGDYATAFREFRPLAELGNAEAQFLIDSMYHYGHGAAKDGAQALQQFILAAEQGDAWTQYNLGVMYQRGRGVARDNAEAVKWFRLAAAQGIAAAQNKLGFMYSNGHGRGAGFCARCEMVSPGRRTGRCVRATDSRR